MNEWRALREAGSSDSGSDSDGGGDDDGATTTRREEFGGVGSVSDDDGGSSPSSGGTTTRREEYGDVGGGPISGGDTDTGGREESPPGAGDETGMDDPDAGDDTTRRLKPGAESDPMTEQTEPDGGSGSGLSPAEQRRLVREAGRRDPGNMSPAERRRIVREAGQDGGGTPSGGEVGGDPGGIPDRSGDPNPFTPQDEGDPANQGINRSPPDSRDGGEASDAAEQAARDLERSMRRSGRKDDSPPIPEPDQGLEDSGADDEAGPRYRYEDEGGTYNLTERDLARELERDFIEQNPRFSDDDIRVTRRDGRFVVALTAQGEAQRQIEAIDVVERQLEGQTGRDIEPGRDFRVRPDESGALIVETTESFEADRRQAAIQSRREEIEDVGSGAARERFAQAELARERLENIMADLDRQMPRSAGVGRRGRTAPGFSIPGLNIRGTTDATGAAFGVSSGFEQRDLGDRPIPIPSWVERIGGFENEDGDARVEDYLRYESDKYAGWAAGVGEGIESNIPLIGGAIGSTVEGGIKAFNPAGAVLVGKEAIETGGYLTEGGEPARDRAAAVAGQAGPLALGVVKGAQERPFEFLGGVGVGALTGVGISKVGTFSRGFVRTAGGTEVPETDIVNTKALDDGSPFPAAEDPALYRENPASAVKSQAAKYTNPDVEARFSEAGVEGTTLKKALDVEPESPGFGRGGFQSPEASGQIYESPGSFFGPELSEYFLRADRPRYSLRPGLPSFGGKPTGVLAKTDVENTQAAGMTGFNRELIERTGEPVAITKPRSSVATGEIEAVVPPEARFSRVSDTGPLNRIGLGSDFYTRVGGRRVPGTDLEFGGRRVPLRLVAPDADAGGAAGVAGDLGSAGRSLAYYSRDFEPVTYRPLPAAGTPSGGSGLDDPLDVTEGLTAPSSRRPESGPADSLGVTSGMASQSGGGSVTSPIDPLDMSVSPGPRRASSGRSSDPLGVTTGMTSEPRAGRGSSSPPGGPTTSLVGTPTEPTPGLSTPITPTSSVPPSGPPRGPTPPTLGPPSSPPSEPPSEPPSRGPPRPLMSGGSRVRNPRYEDEFAGWKRLVPNDLINPITTTAGADPDTDDGMGDLVSSEQDGMGLDTVFADDWGSDLAFDGLATDVGLDGRAGGDLETVSDDANQGGGLDLLESIGGGGRSRRKGGGMPNPFSG